MLKRKASCPVDESTDTVPTKRSLESNEIVYKKKSGNEANSLSLPAVASSAGPSSINPTDSSIVKNDLLDAPKITAEQTNAVSDKEQDEAASTSSMNSDVIMNQFGFSFDSDSDDCDAGENKWLPMAGPMSWVQKQMNEGKNPREILSQLLPSYAQIPEGVHDVMLWKIIVSILSEPPRRKKLQSQNTVQDLLTLISRCSRILVLTGAGVSVSCGIPDFRSRDGLYARLAVEYPDLPDPQAMFDINYFKGNPYPFFKFAKEIYPGQFIPSPSHKFIKLLESKGKLLRNYTQNIDTLEQVAGITNVIQCHGSFASATCMNCKNKVSCEDVKEEILHQEIPRCKLCPPDAAMAIIKPDIVFFGESLPEEFHEQMADDKTICDLLIVIGSSLKVRPVSLIPNSLPANIPQVLINREPLPHQTFDIELLGDCDVIVQELIHQLGWEAVTKPAPAPLTEIGLDQLISLEPPPEIKVDNRYSMRATENTISDQSMCSTADVDASQISSFKLNLRGEYLNPMEGSQLSVIGHLKVNDGMTNDQPLAHTSPQHHPPPGGAANNNCKLVASSSFATPAAVLPLPGSTAAASKQEHTFLGKIGDFNAKHEDNILPTTSANANIIDKQNISSRLPENTYLFLEPSRYVFKGAELISEDEEESDEDNDSFSSNASEINESPIMEDVASQQPLTSDDNEMQSSEECENGGDRNDMRNERQLNRQFFSHDEDAIDAFPESSNSTQTLISNDRESSTSHHSHSHSHSHSQSRPFNIDD